MGGQLQVKAIFPEGEVEIEQFGSMAEPREKTQATTHA
jgi:hypothetical protein